MAYLKDTIVDSTLQVKEKIETVNLETQSISIVGGGGTQTLQECIEQLAKQLILEYNKKKYYIGKIIVDTANINPSTYLGFGTWELWGSGKCPVGVLTTDTDFATVEKTGGSKTVTLTTNQIPSHTHTFTGNDTGSSGAHTHTLNGHTHSFSATTSSAGGHTHTLNNHTHTYTKANGATEGHKLTIAEMPKHSHQTYMSSAPVNVSTGSGWLIKYLGEPKDRVTDTGGDGSHSHTIKASSANTGSNNGNTSNNGAHTHSVSGTTGANSSNTTSNGGHTHTTSGTNSNTGGGGSHNNLQPYITCYFWKRVA